MIFVSASIFAAFTTTIALFPGDMSGFSPATCRWGKVSVAGEYSLGKLRKGFFPQRR
ncbi:hypothetical protein Tco_0621321, partial [Tanacetum coccineum]